MEAGDEPGRVIRGGGAMLREGVEEGPVRREAHGDEAAESPAMDERIWALLPPELMDNILARLPVAQLFWMRTVCRRFRALTQSPSFLSSRTATMAPEHWLLMFLEDGVAPGVSMAAYDPCVKHWHYLPMQHLSFYKYGIKSMASAQGLVCIASEDDGQCSITVWNPLTYLWRELRRMSLKGVMSVGLMVDSATKAFVVVAAGLTEESLLITHVYDSVEGVWKPTQTSSIEWHGCHIMGQLVFCNGCFHAIGATNSKTYHRLISYVLEQGVWKETCNLPFAKLRSNLVIHASWSLFEVPPGRLFVAERTTSRPNQHRKLFAIHLWELKQLEDDAVEWIEVATVPQAILMEMRQMIWMCSNLECRAIGNLVCFVASGDIRGLAYDLTRDAWYWMPHRREPGFIVALSFEPRLDMLSV